METTCPSAPARAASGEPIPTQVLFRRRRFLVHRRYQLRVTLLVVGTTLLLLLLLNLSLLASNHRSTSAALEVAPELRSYFEAQDRFQLALILLGSAAFLAGVFLLSILETHRTAGAAFSICRGIEELAGGDCRARVRLRRGDNLKEIGEAVNRLAGSLAQRTRDEAERLEEISARAGSLTSPEGGAIREEILEMARAKRALSGSP